MEIKEIICIAEDYEYKLSRKFNSMIVFDLRKGDSQEHIQKYH